MKMMFRRITAILLVLVMTGLLSYTVMAEEAETPAEEPAAVSEELADVQEGEEGTEVPAPATPAAEIPEVTEETPAETVSEEPAAPEAPAEEPAPQAEPVQVPETPAEPVETPDVPQEPVETPAEPAAVPAETPAEPVVIEDTVIADTSEETITPDSPAVVQEMTETGVTVEEDAQNEVHTHTPVAYEDKEATPFSKGQKGGTYCSECGEVITAPTELDYTSLTRVLARGMTGDDVLALQQKLYELGFLTVVPDGVYGGYTEAAVNIFQAEQGLANPDGKVGSWSTSVLRMDTAYYNISYGMNNTGVKYLQTCLKQKGYLDATPDGIFGGKTLAALRKFQIVNGLAVTGIADISTYMLLARGAGASFRMLQKGMSGADVSSVQNILKEAGFYDGAVTGSFDSDTEAAVLLFQAFNGLDVPDGKVGNWTYGVLLGSHNSFSDLSMGQKGPAVKLLQKYLKNRGYLAVTPDGVFGAKTLSAVKFCQQMFDLEENGIINFETAMAILNGTAPVGSGFQRGDSGSEIYALQQKLYELGYLIAEPDGNFGGGTYAAVCAFQAANGLSVPDGRVGSWTQNLLNGSPAPFKPVTPNSSKAEIMAMQREMYNYGYVGSVDGLFGGQTEMAVKQVQKWFGLPQTGQADAKTLYYLYNINDYTANPYSVQNYYSATSWLIYINCTSNRLYLYNGYRGNWTLYDSWAVDTGRTTDPTVLGEYTTGGKGYVFGDGYSCYYYTSFYRDYLMHSTLYSQNTFNRTDSRLGLNLSAGCVRMDIERAKWIYYNIPWGTKVVTVRP